jgi:hypothetical protein
MSKQGVLDGMFSEPRTVSPASLENWHERICPTLTEREFEVMLAIYRYLYETGHEDCTGGEVAEHSGISILSTRPRITGLIKRGLLNSGAMRASRCKWEQRCCPVWPTLPRSAVERARSTQEQGKS